MKTSMSLSAKIISLILLFCLTSLASGFYSISSMASIGKKIHNLSTVEIPLQNQVAKISEHQLNEELALTGAALNLELERRLHNGLGFWLFGSLIIRLVAQSFQRTQSV